MIVTLYPHARTAEPAAENDCTWEDFADTLEIEAQREGIGGDPAEQKRGMLSWSPVRLRPGTTRSNANVEAVTALALDIDEGDPRDVVMHLKAKGWAGLVYESASSTPEAPRFRVVVPTTRDMTPDETRATRLGLAEVLGFTPSPTVGVDRCLDPCRVFFVGRLQGTPERAVVRVEGKPCNPARLPAPRLAWGKAAAPRVDLVPLEELPPGDAGIAVALGDWQEHQGRKFDVCGAVGGMMRRLGFSRGQCEATIREWLPGEGHGVDVAAGVAWACAAWDVPVDSVSGHTALADLLGEQHATHVEAAGFAGSWAGRGVRTPWAKPVEAPTGAWKRLSFADDDVPIDYYCAGLRLAPSDGKISVIGGMPGAAKGPIADHLALCFAHGLEAFGKFPCRRSRTMLLDCEGARLTRRRIRRMARAMGVNPREVEVDLIDITAEDVLSQDFYARLKAEAPEVLILDSYTSAMLTTGVDAKGPEWATLARMLGSLDILVLAVTHTNKIPLPGEKPTLQHVAGHHALAGMAATGISAHKPDPDDENRVRLGCMRAPETGFATFDVVFSDVPGDGLAIALEGLEVVAARERASETETRTAVANRVLAFMRTNEAAPFSRKSISGNVTGKQSTIYEVVASLREVGVLLYHPSARGHDQYQLSPTAPRAVEFDDTGACKPAPTGFRRITTR